MQCAPDGWWGKHPALLKSEGHRLSGTILLVKTRRNHCCHTNILKVYSMRRNNLPAHEDTFENLFAIKLYADL